MRQRALFLDRDGVINIDHGYVCSRDRFEFVDGIFDLCGKAVGQGYLIMVVTNQAGIGRGYFSEQQFHALTDWMCETFRARAVPIARVYFCPFHPEHGVGIYKQDSECRKPRPGMILQAARDYRLDLAGSCLVGDNETDIAAGIAAGVGRNILFRPAGRGLHDTGATAMDDLARIGSLLFDRDGRV